MPRKGSGKLEDRHLGGLQVQKGAVSGSKLEGAQAVVIWGSAREKDRSAKPGVKEKMVC